MPKKQYIVTQVKPDKDMTGVSVDGKEMKFSKSGRSFYMSDAGMAKELDQTLGSAGTRDVVISELPMTNKDGVHNYTFTIKKPKLENDQESKWIWVDDGKGRQKMVKKDASIRTD